MVIDRLLDRLTTGEKIVWGSTSFVGVYKWYYNLHFFAVSWGPVLSTVMSALIPIISTVGGVIAIDYYKEHWKHKLFKSKHDAKTKSKAVDDERAA